MMYNNFGHPTPYVDHMSWFGSNFGILGGLVGLLVFAASVAVVVAIVVAIVRHARRAHGTTAVPAATVGVAPAAGTTEDEALRIARERLARGEIDADQYRIILEVLSS